eukprot:CAMPEP_0114566224 /NCGR_PEP_ID=MMETSP0114-20121206/14766_1 /TAXON_ID=31324 /ORGANISM="Goniomonas sp, Strain m" /LENGTH=167 /DNA_ID=CAMNT_0001752597 /DNA_START=27 /DNA_END=526 /DNA_ORIENTATION=+
MNKENQAISGTDQPSNGSVVSSMAGACLFTLTFAATSAVAASSPLALNVTDPSAGGVSGGPGSKTDFGDDPSLIESCDGGVLGSVVDELWDGGVVGSLAEGFGHLGGLGEAGLSVVEGLWGRGFGGLLLGLRWQSRGGEQGAVCASGSRRGAATRCTVTRFATLTLG